MDGREKSGVATAAYIVLSSLVCASALTEPETLDVANPVRNRHLPSRLLCGTKASVVDPPSTVLSGHGFSQPAAVDLAVSIEPRRECRIRFCAHAPR